MGNRPVRNYTPQDVHACLTLLEGVPASHGKSGDRMPIREAIAAADESEAIARAKAAAELRNAPPWIREEPEEACLIPRLGTATIQRHLSNPRTIFEWSVISGERPENPFAPARPNSTELAVACCQFLGHEDKIVSKELESGCDETEVQPQVQDRGRKAGDGPWRGGGSGRA